MLQRNYNEEYFARAKAHFEQENPHRLKMAAQKAEEEIQAHYPTLSPEEVAAMKKEMEYAKLCYNCSAYDFFLYRFDRLPFDEWGTYITSNRGEYTNLLIPSAELQENMRDKYWVYQNYKEFYRRDVILIRSSCDLPTFIDFVGKHPCFIAKKRRGSCGFSVKKIDVQDEGVYGTFQTLLQSRPCLLEEVIVQSAEMMRLNETSVNTLRAPVLAGNGKVRLFDPLMRIGKRGAVADNFTSGGILALVDEETGRVCTKFFDRDLNTFTRHPDTGVDLENYQVPHWDEAVAFLEKLATHLPGYGILGWDIALTEAGWVLIETNICPHHVGQMADGKGHLPKLDRLVREIGFEPCPRPFMPPREQP